MQARKKFNHNNNKIEIENVTNDISSEVGVMLRKQRKSRTRY